MRRVTFNEGGDEEVVFILGWGNRPEHETVRWLIDQVADAGYQVTAFQIPTVVSDFDREWLDPVAQYVAGLEKYRLLTHSTGGLIGEFLEDPEPLTKTHLSPWWGLHEDLDNPLVSLAMKVPTTASILPAGFERTDLGELATEQQVADTPSRVAPTFLREAKRGQERLPPFEDGTVVFYSPTDPVVGAGAIEARAPESNRVAYEGGHELFGSRSREAHIDTVLAAIDEGISALD